MVRRIASEFPVKVYRVIETPVQRRTAAIIAAHNVSPIQVSANTISPSTFHVRIASSHWQWMKRQGASPVKRFDDGRIVADRAGCG
jgi:hypothetical protein